MSHGYHKKHRTASKKAREAESTDFQTITKYSMLGTLISTLSVMILTPICSAVCLLFPDPAALVLPAALIVLYISCGIGGFISGNKLRRHKGSALVCGSLSGFGTFVLFGIVGTILSLFKLKNPAVSETFVNLLLKSVSIVSSISGAFLATKRQRKYNKHKK